MINVRTSPEVLQRAPRADAIWVSYSFFGGCHAMRREALDRVGPYRAFLFHWGEERDFAIRLLNAGYVARLGTADPVHHIRSDVRDRRKANVFIYRNDILFPWYNIPSRYLPTALATATARNIMRAIQGRDILYGLNATLRGYRDCLHEFRQRKPVSPSVFRYAMQLRRRKAMLLEEVEPMLPPWPRTPDAHVASHAGAVER